MTVETTDMAIISEYTVSDSGASGLTTAMFNYYFAKAQETLDNDLANISGTETIPTETYDYCHGLLIAHLYTVKKGQTGFQSVNAQGTSFTRSPGESTYSLQYKDELKKWSETVSAREIALTPSIQTDVKRCDAEMPGLMLDHSKPPAFFRSLTP